MCTKEIPIPSIQDLDIAAGRLLKIVGDRKILAFEGEIGAGKTTFIKALCREIGVKEEVTSPTFSIANEYLYKDEKGKERRIFHLDLYRLEDMEEAINIGMEEYLDSGEICLIEWPELIKPLLPDDVVQIKMVIEEDFSRKLLFL